MNAKIKEIYGDRYADWYDLATEMIQVGATHFEIIERFTALGVTVSQFTIHSWLKDRRDQLAA